MPMKKANAKSSLLSLGTALLIALGASVAASAADNPRSSYQQPVPAPNNATQGMQAAEQELKVAGSQFTQAEPLPLTPVGSTQANNADPGAAQANPAQKTTAKPLSQTPKEPVITGTRGVIPPAEKAGLLGSPETGFSGTWTDPANGDVITSVIAPTPPPASQAYPVYVEPQINGVDWGNNSWNNGNWNSGNWSNGGWNNGWQPNGYPQWPGYPGDPGYMPPPPPSRTPVIPPYATGQPPYLPPTPGLNMPSYPPPHAPGYRPLRPGGNGGTPPPNHGWNPGPGANGPYPGPNFQPNHGFPPPSQGFQPGSGQPGANPGFRPLPMRPGGTTWGNSPFSSQPGGSGMFRRGGN